VKSSARATTARTLLWLAGALIAVGLVVLSSAASFLCMLLAAVAAFAALPLGTRPTQRLALVLLAVSLVLALAAWPQFKAEQQRIQQRAHRAAP
jgi:membrane protein implicated in regulation of membrane protease activity